MLRVVKVFVKELLAPSVIVLAGTAYGGD